MQKPPIRTISLIAAIFVVTAAVAVEQPSRGVTPAAQDRKHIMLPTRSDSLPFSDAVLVGNTLHLAGKIGIDPQSGKPPQDVEQEIRLLLEGVKSTLAAADMSMDDLVTVTVFCPDLSLYDKFNEIYRTYFTEKFPARAFIGSGPLLRGGHFEMQGTAIKH